MDLSEWIKTQKNKYLVFIMRGVPGSGKSFLSKWIQNNTPCNVKIVSADYFFTKGGIYKFERDKLGDAHAACFNDFLNYMINGVHIVIVDNVNSVAEYISPYHLGAKALGYHPVIINVVTDPEIAFDRQTHGVPRKNHDSMIKDVQKGLGGRLSYQWEKVDVKATNDRFEVLSN